MTSLSGICTTRSLCKSLKFYRSLGQNLTDSELISLISRVDTNRNGTIEFHEFLRLVVSKKQVSFEDDIHKAFELFDKVACYITEQSSIITKSIKLKFIVRFRTEMDS